MKLLNEHCKDSSLLILYFPIEENWYILLKQALYTISPLKEFIVGLNWTDNKMVAGQALEYHKIKDLRYDVLNEWIY